MDRLAFGEFSGKVLSAHESAEALICVSAHPAAEAVRPHAHATPYFCLVLGGGFWENSCLGEKSCRAGALTFHPQGDPHEDRILPQSALCLNIQLRSCWLDRDDLWLRDSFFGFGSPAARMATKIGHLASSGNLERLDTLIADLCQAVAPRVVTAWEDPVAKRAKKLLSSKFAEPVRLPSVAAEIGVHTSHLSRTFHRSYGRTCGEYLSEVRLTHASRLLASSSDTLAEVAIRCGYYDQSHMTNVFSREVGLSPAAYRSVYTIGNHRNTG